MLKDLNYLEIGFIVLVTIASFWAVYFVDRRYVRPNSKFGPRQHLLRTDFFPRRALAYTSILMIAMVFAGSARENATPNSLAHYIYAMLFNAFMVPALLMFIIVTLTLLVMIIHPFDKVQDSRSEDKEA